MIFIPPPPHPTSLAPITTPVPLVRHANAHLTRSPHPLRSSTSFAVTSDQHYCTANNDGPAYHSKDKDLSFRCCKDAAPKKAPAVNSKCLWLVSQTNVGRGAGAVAGKSCTGKGACLLIEPGNRYTCEIDPSHFSHASVCSADNGIWCEPSAEL